MNRLLRYTLAGLLLAAPGVAVARAECGLQTLKPQGSEVRAGALIVNLGEADDPAHPAAWQGPLLGGSCKLELSIIEPPLALAAGRYLYVPVYSGSVRRLNVVDLQNCAVVWQSVAFSGALIINPKGLVLDGKPLGLNGECLPVAEK